MISLGRLRRGNIHKHHFGLYKPIKFLDRTPYSILLLFDLQLALCIHV